jgi:hypothetical protein
MSKRAARHAKAEERSNWPSRRQILWGFTVVTLGAAGGGLAWRASRPAVSEGDAAATSTLAPQHELRPTLEPAAFTGKARRAYEVARQIPGVLDRLHCYCRCDPYGHRTLLSCYTDNHAST